MSHFEMTVQPVGPEKTGYGENTSATYNVETGWEFPFAINPTQVTTETANGGSVSLDGSAAFLQTGINTAGKASIQTVRHVAHIPGVSVIARYSCVFGQPADNSTQICGIGNSFEGFFIGYNGLEFGVMVRKGGVDTWTPKAAWTGYDDAEFDPLKINTYEIAYILQGGSVVSFSFLNMSGGMMRMHKAVDTNQSTEPTLNNGSLPLRAEVENGGNASNIQLRTTSASAGIHGQPFPEPFTILTAFSMTKVFPATAGGQYAFSLQNPLLFNGRPNTAGVAPVLMTVSYTSNKEGSLNIYAGVGLTNPVWVDVTPGLSPLQYDLLATAYEPFSLLYSTGAGISGTIAVDLSVLSVRIQPGQLIIFEITTNPTGSSASVLISLDFKSRS